MPFHAWCFYSTSSVYNDSHYSVIVVTIQEEAQYQEQATQRKQARGRGSNSSTAPQGMEFWGSKAFTSSRWQPPERAGTSQLTAPSQIDLDSLYEGYFRGLFPNGSETAGNHHSLDNVQVWRFVEGRSQNNSMAGRHLRLGGEYSNYEDSSNNTTTTSGLETLGGRGEYPAYESVQSRSSSRSSSSSDTRDTLEPGSVIRQPHLMKKA